MNTGNVALRYPSEWTMGVVGTHRKENEHRVPLHPDHLERLPAALRTRLFFEEGYASHLGADPARIAALSGGFCSREEALGKHDVVLLAKPLVEDLRQIREGAVLFGWPHCVQQRDITQVAIDRKLTLIAWEAMFTYARSGEQNMHIFYRNNELAGYCAVLHAFQLMGLDGLYGPARKAVVLGFGSVSRGAIHALQGRGVVDIAIYTSRDTAMVHDRIPGCVYGTTEPDPDRPGCMLSVAPDGKTRPMIEVLAEADILVNGVLQNPNHPVFFVSEGEEERLRKEALIIDVSCDEAMGFHFAKPTSFAEPMFRVGHCNFYAVDHTPSYLAATATWEISEAVIPYLAPLLEGPEAWKADETLRRAVEIREGVIQNEAILRFQKRAAEYPHLDQS